MAKRKKRNAVTLVSLLLTLGLLLGFYLWYSNREETTGDSGSVTETIDLAKVDSTQLESLHYLKEDADITFVLKDQVWISKEEPDRPINQDYVKAILNAIDDIKADRIIMEKAENLADYGLEEPSAALIATLKDGNKVTLKIGSKAGDSLGYYGLVNEDGIVYLLPIELGTALQYTNIQMTAVPEGPNITAESIDYLNIDQLEGEDYELKYNTSGELDNTGSNMYSWDILKPYGKGYTADSTKMSEIQSKFTNFDFIDCIDYKGGDLSQYGLKEPTASIQIGYYTEQTSTLENPETDPETGEEITEKTTRVDQEYKVYIGDKNEDGNYYIREEGSNAVYTIGASSIEAMLELDTFTIMNPYILLPNIEDVDQIEVEIGGISYQLRIDRTTQTTEEGEEEVATYYFNNTKMEEEDFKKLYQTLISAQYDTEIKEEVAADGVEPYLTISFHIFGANEKTVSASFLPYNDSFYMVQKEDGVRFFIDKRKVEDIADAVSSLPAKSSE
jgi:hypothetical protein